MKAPPGFRGAFRTDDRARALYSEGAGPFRLLPAAVAFPEDRDDVALLLAWGATTGTPLTARGAGSGMPGGNVGPGVVVDLAAFDRPLRVELSQRATVGAAVTWHALNTTAAHFGFRLPPDPSSGAFCTAGGMVATNASGARSYRFGSVRPWVRGVELVTVDGEAFWLHRTGAEPSRPPEARLLGQHPLVLERLADVTPNLRDARPLIARHFPTTRKNSAGYALDSWTASGDVLDLVIGSEGTLGLVTRVEFALAPVPASGATLLVGLAALEELDATIARVAAHEPVAIELLDRSLLEHADGALDPALAEVAAVLLVEFEGDQATVEGLSRAAADAVTGAALVWRAVESKARAELWALRHAASPALARLPDTRRSLQVIEDGCVPTGALGAYLDGVRAAAAAVAIPVIAFGHAGDGHLHVNALADGTAPDVATRLLELRRAAAALLRELDGTPSGEHGDGRLRADLLEAFYGPELMAVFRQVKDAFDPAGILNPGVILPAGPLPPFKVGPEAPALPDDVRAALRRREREASWGVPPLRLLEESA